MARDAKDLELVLHIGLHKTASTYIQNVLSARRYDLVQHGVFYPNTGTFEEARVRTRDGAQAGHFQLTFRGGRQALLEQLLDEVPPLASTVLLSAEDLTALRQRPERHMDHFGIFGSVKVVAVVRRQDTWIESMYKQAVDQWSSFETRSLPRFVAEEGPRLLDYHSRLSAWRALVGPENFHVLSYDDLGDGAAILRRVLEIAGVPKDRLGEYPGVEAPRYDSIRGIDTLGMRILNGYRLSNRNIRNKAAREIYASAPSGDIELMNPELRAGIQERCAPVNERIEREWLAEPAPGLRFAKDVRTASAGPPSSSDLLAYLDRVFAVCDEARALDDAEREAGAEAARAAVTPSVVAVAATSAARAADGGEGSDASQGDGVDE